MKPHHQHWEHREGRMNELTGKCAKKGQRKLLLRMHYTKTLGWPGATQIEHAEHGSRGGTTINRGEGQHPPAATESKENEELLLQV